MGKDDVRSSPIPSLPDTRKFKILNYVSMAKFTNKILPLLRSLAFECSLPIVHSQPFPQLLTDSIFTELRTCDQLVDINTGNYGQKCLHFISHHIESGHLKELRLPGRADWPDTVKPLLLSFVKSPKFKELDVSRSNLKLDSDMVAAFVDRFFEEDLPNLARISGTPSFALMLLNDIHQESSFGEQLTLPVAWILVPIDDSRQTGSRQSVMDRNPAFLP
uniref:Rho-GAP domain-containing protein n=1 Tax=Steinernema glaseri TaxID=37863 RepID=A0A1I7Z070_9BILA